MLMHAQTKIIAHRGYSSIAPENTIIAFQKAIESGAEYFELDIHESKDGALIVIHDASVDKTSSNGKRGEIGEMTLEELNEVKVGYSRKFGDKFLDEGIPTLREALQFAKGKIKVCIEIKVYGVEDKVVDLVQELDMIDEVIVFSFYYPVVAKIRKLDDLIQTLYLISEADDLTAGYAKVIDANAIGLGRNMDLSREFINEAHQKGIEVWMWTIDDEDEMKQLMKVGLDGLITNYPRKALLLRD